MVWTPNSGGAKVTAEHQEVSGADLWKATALFVGSGFGLFGKAWHFIPESAREQVKKRAFGSLLSIIVAGYATDRATGSHVWNSVWPASRTEAHESKIMRLVDSVSVRLDSLDKRMSRMEDTLSAVKQGQDQEKDAIVIVAKKTGTSEEIRRSLYQREHPGPHPHSVDIFGRAISSNP